MTTIEKIFRFWIENDTRKINEPYHFCDIHRRQRWYQRNPHTPP